jgi:hypothetical protein
MSKIALLDTGSSVTDLRELGAPWHAAKSKRDVTPRGADRMCRCSSKGRARRASQARGSFRAEVKAPA